MPLLKTLIGKENTAQASSQIWVFHSPRPEQRGRKEEHLNAVCRDPASSSIVRKQGVTVNTPSVMGIKKEIGGEMTEQTYEVGEGEIIKIWVSRKQSWNRVPQISCLFIQMRTTGPLQCIRAKLLQTPTTRFKTADFSGRFDVLTLAEAQKKGVVVAPQYVHYFAPQAVAVGFTIDVLEEETAERPSMIEKPVTTSTGNTVVYTARQRRRAVEM